MTSYTVAQLEKGIEDAKELIKNRDLALKLSENHEFRKLIMDEFCVKESARLVHLSSDPAMDPLQRADALSMAQAAGHLRRYLSMTIKQGDAAADQMPELYEALEATRAEENDEDND